VFVAQTLKGKSHEPFSVQLDLVLVKKAFPHGGKPLRMLLLIVTGTLHKQYEMKFYGRQVAAITINSIIFAALLRIVIMQ